MEENFIIYIYQKAIEEGVFTLEDLEAVARASQVSLEYSSEDVAVFKKVNAKVSGLRVDIKIFQNLLEKHPAISKVFKK